jgi:hypothetical protein
MNDVPEISEQFNHDMPDDHVWEHWSKSIRHRAPTEIRRGEVIEGGFVIIERTRKKRLLRAASWPVEVGSMRDAIAAVERLRKKCPEKTFCIFHQVAIAEAG